MVSYVAQSLKPGIQVEQSCPHPALHSGLLNEDWCEKLKLTETMCAATRRLKRNVEAIPTGSAVT